MNTDFAVVSEREVEGFAELIRLWPFRPCRLTPPSSGHPPAGCACLRPPLMSNVRRHFPYCERLVPCIAKAARSNGLQSSQARRRRSDGALIPCCASDGPTRRAAAALASDWWARHTETSMPQANALSLRDCLPARAACPRTPLRCILTAAGSPNRSIERTFQSVLRTLWPAAHLQR
jgi:hypothetical protein